MTISSKFFLIFQASFWAVIAVLNMVLAFAVGHRDLHIPGQRAFYVFLAGALLSTLAAILYERLGTHHPSRRNWLMILGGSLVMAALTALIVNPVTWSITGHNLGSLSMRQLFTSYLNFFLYFVVWSFLCFQLQGRKVIDASGGLETAPFMERITVEKSGDIAVLDCADILHIEAEGDYVALTTAQGTWLKIGTINSFEESLNPELFLRIHRSRLINKSKVASVAKAPRGRFDFQMEGGAVLSSSPGRKAAVMAALPAMT